MAQLRIKQVRSKIGTKQNHRETLRTLGLRRINDEVVREDRPEVRGMLHTVKHLVTVEEVD
jgi:large subunit ribosomal protein L30